MNLKRHLNDRQLWLSLYDGIQIVEEEDLVIFPLWNLSGQMVGYQQYRPNATKDKKNDPREGRYYTSLHGNKYEKPLGVWGLETYHFDSRYLFITEGIFDACRLHNLGIPAVALLNSSHKHYKNWLTSTGRRIIKVEDDHGSSLGPYENLSIPSDRSDLGECTDDEIFDALLNSIGISGLDTETYACKYMSYLIRNEIDNEILESIYSQ